MQDSAAVLPSVSALNEARGAFEGERLLAPAQALARYFGTVALPKPRRETVPLDAAYGRIAASDVVAREDHPGFARSTMDGYAVASVAARAGARLRVTGEIRMGAAPPHAIAPHETLRIPTGGALPGGADAVVPQEDVARDGDAIVLRDAVAARACITSRGDDIGCDETLFPAGRRIGAPELAVLATLGYARVEVYARPRVAIVSTGDELVDPARTPGIGQVRDSNRYALGGALLALGTEPVHVAGVADDERAVAVALHEALESCDGILLTGGSSVGAHDVVPRAIARLGEPGIVVHGLRVKPGKPTLLGAARGKPVIGLPGNPASALAICEAVVRPILQMLSGERITPPMAYEAIADAAFTGRLGWTWYVPARMTLRGTRLHATPLPLRSAHASLLARAGGYAMLGENDARIEVGGMVRIFPFLAGGAPVEVA